MPIKKLNSIFKPKRIALIGVSNNPDSVGGITLRNLVSGGFNGVVYPVNPKREAVFGIPTNTTDALADELLSGDGAFDFGLIAHTGLKFNAFFLNIS